MQEVDIDPLILHIPPTQIDETKLNLKLSTSANEPSQALISQINEKINYLDIKKSSIEESFNKEINDITRSGKEDALNLSINLKQPLDSAFATNTNLKDMRDQYVIIQKNIEHLIQLKKALIRRKALKEMKNEALRLKKFYEIFENLKRSYENRDFIRVSILYNQMKQLNVGDRIKIADDLISPANLMKTINNELFRICQEEFNDLTLFQCLLFVKEPSDVVQIVTYNKKFDFKNANSLESIIDIYKYRFDVIYAISRFKKKANIIGSNAKPWKMPLDIWNLLESQKLNLINTITLSFTKFICNLKTQQYPMIPDLLNKWERLESLLFLTKSFPIIAFRITMDILNNGNIDCNIVNHNSTIKNGLLFQYLNECFILFQNQIEKNNFMNSKSSKFVKNIIESIVIFMLRALIYNNFNQANNPSEFNQENHPSSKKVEYFNNKSMALLNNESLLNELTIKSNINVEIIQNDLLKFKKLIDKSDSLINYFYEDGFYDEVVGFLPSFLYYSIPIFIGEKNAKSCSQDLKFTELKLKAHFQRWSEKFEISERLLRNIALKYFNENKSRSLFGVIKATEPDELFKKYYPLPPT